MRTPQIETASAQGHTTSLRQKCGRYNDTDAAIRVAASTRCRLDKASTEPFRQTVNQLSMRPGGIVRRIAVVVNALDAAYQMMLVRYLHACCEKRHFELVVFPGGVLRDTEQSTSPDNSIYDLIDLKSIDALVLATQTIQKQVGLEGVSEFCRRFSHLALCSVGAELPGIPSLLIDNAGGIRQLVRHLIVDHHHRSIAYIAGPPGNGEARERYQGYCDELRAHSIELDPELAVEGDFLPESGEQAVRTLLEQRHLRPDAIVAANDYMAIGALDALAKSDSIHAKKVRVVGFDNVDDANFTTPPLTTVQQPLAAMADAAVSCLVAQLDRRGPGESARLETQLVVRRSCGCLLAPVRKTGFSRIPAEGHDYHQKLLRRRDRIRAELARASGGSFGGVDNWEYRLIDTLVDDLRGVPGDRFLTEVEAVLQGIAQRGGDLWRFDGVLSALRKQALQCMAPDEIVRTKTEDLLHNARSLGGEAIARTEGHKLLGLERLIQIVNDVGARLAQSASAPSLRKSLNAQLPRLGIRRSFIILHDTKADGERAFARVFHAFDSERGECTPRAELRFAAEQIVPGELWLKGRSLSWIVMPLFCAGTKLGYAVLDLSLKDAAYYEILRVHLSTALFRALSTFPQG